MEENPLQRAHAISAQASGLIKGISVPIEDLRQALDLYRTAAELFDTASKTRTGEDERRTLTLLVNQHKKLVRDVERRIAAAERIATAGPSDQSQPGKQPDTAHRPTTGLRSITGEGSGTGRKEPVGLASAATIGQWPAGISTRLGVPPFALRHTNLSQPPLHRAATSPPNTSPHASQHNHNESFSLSPLHSSSSSDESFFNLGVVPETLDPFSRFWGMLENMLDDISNPVAFASAPLGTDTVPPPSRKLEYDSKNSERKDRDIAQRASSPSESFYVVPSGPSRRAGSPPTLADPIPQRPQPTGSTSGKTPEELALENDNLRTSLDAIASHAEKLERANKALRTQHDEREKTMRSIAVGMRREAQKVKQGQDLIRSQLIASVSNSPRSARMNHSPGDTTSPPNGEGDAALKARIRELEEQVKSLKSESQKHKEQADRYKDKIKANARAKREARAVGEGASKSTMAIRRDSEE